MKISSRRVRAVVRKDLREFRRNRSLIAGMAVLPVIFTIQPLITVFALDASASAPLSQEHVLLYMLGIPALVPSIVAASSVVGERQQGTLEPVLTTPLPGEELLLGKALATFLPSVAVAYVVFGLFLACVALFADPGVASALIRPADLVGQVLFTPLLAGWSIWVAILISARSNDVRVAQQLATLADVRVAQQLATLASVPSIAITTLVALNVIAVSAALAVAAAVALALLNILGWRLTSAAFDRERLTTGTSS